MSLRHFSRKNLLGAATSSPWTSNFRHLLPIPKKWMKRTSVRDPLIKSVRPKDRIKYWNIVPGDQIRLLGDKENKLHEVLSINRISNRVFVKGAVEASETQQGKVPPSKNYHYSRCQLFLGNYEFPSAENVATPKVLPVFAKRLGTKTPFWNPFFHRFEWERFATKTIPPLPSMREERIAIPWPKTGPTKVPEPGQYDTLKDEVARVTYVPPSFPIRLNGVVPRPPSEDDYLTFLYNPGKKLSVEISESAPVEVFLFRDLANPHSRAKKLKRWKQRQFLKKKLLKKFVSDEMNFMNGRSEREVKAEAMHKWGMYLREEKEALRKQRWKHKAAAEKMEKKSARKERKELKQRKRLTELVLKEGPNQFIPKDVVA